MMGRFGDGKTQYARTEIKTAFLNTDFGYSYACKLFGAEAIDSLPMITRGTRKGQRKGCLHWEKATVGGWSDGGVKLPGLVRAWVSEYFDHEGRRPMSGNWMGKIQPISGNREFMFEDGRARGAKRSSEYAASLRRDEIEQHEISRDQAIQCIDALIGAEASALAPELRVDLTARFLKQLTYACNRLAIINMLNEGRAA